jgi:hypothetical protein
MFITRGVGEKAFFAIYSGSLFGIEVVVDLGLDEYDNCVWHVVATQDDSVIFDQSYEVDHDDVTCLSVPTAMEIAGVEGMTDCVGTLLLDDHRKARLPYLKPEASEVPEGKFRDLDESYEGACGECGQVCSRICLHGKRHANGEVEHAEFSWFDDETGRGWAFVALGSNFTERIYLMEDEYGNCMLVPALEEGSGNEIFQPIVIDMEQGCSCGLEELFATEVDNEIIASTVRCGNCSCWHFFCGNCRCVPEEICVVVIDEVDATYHLLLWDPDERRWGTDADRIRLVLGSDQGQCTVSVDMAELYSPIEGVATFSCGPPAEVETGEFTPDSDFFTFELGEPSIPLTIFGSSLIPDCVRGKCDEATPCNAECGGHPDQLFIHIHEWSEPGDTSGYPVDCSYDVVVYFWQTADLWEGAGLGIKYSCGYVGYLTLGDCLIRFEFRNALLRFIAVGSECAAFANEGVVEMATEECDPYFADSGEIIGSVFLDCPDSDGAYRHRVTITE